MRPGTETLAKLTLFASFGAAQIARLNEAADMVRVGEGEVLFREGNRVDELNILLAGFVLITCIQDGEDAPVDIVGPTGPIGLPAATLGCASTVSASTVTSARLIVIPSRDLRTVLRAKAGPILGFFDYALTILNEQTAEISALKLHTSLQRLAKFLLDQLEDPETQPARFALPYEKRYLASKIGCGKENLSRAFAALRFVGVRTEGRVVLVHDVSALRALVESSRIARPTPDQYRPGAPRHLVEPAS